MVAKADPHDGERGLPFEAARAQALLEALARLALEALVVALVVVGPHPRSRGVIVLGVAACVVAFSFVDRTGRRSRRTGPRTARPE